MDEEFYGKYNEVNDEEISHVVFEERKDKAEAPNIGSSTHSKNEAIVAVPENAKLYVILGWISAALTFFISPLFAVAGIAFGFLLNKQIKGSGNTLIIANIVLGLMNLVLGIVFILLAERIVGY
jgi:hypothetical protein